LLAGVLFVAAGVSAGQEQGPPSEDQAAGGEGEQAGQESELLEEGFLEEELSDDFEEGFVEEDVDEALDGGETGNPTGDESPLSGFLSTTYRGRWTPGASDHDLWGIADIGYDDGGKWSGRLMARLYMKIGGAQSADSPFFDLRDTYDPDIDADIYYAYADYNGFEELSQLRLGRQFLYETPVTLWLDGLHVQTAQDGDERWQFGAYGGIPTYQYESSSSGDWLAGVYAQGTPWSGGTVRADWVHLQDTNVLGRHDDDLISLALTQRTLADTTPLRFDLEGSMLAGSERDARFATSFYDPENDLSLEASFYELFQTQLDLSVPLDPFFTTLFELSPYYQATFLGSKGWDDVGLQLGGDLRRVRDSDDIGQFNRDFDRFYLTGSLENTLPYDLGIALTAEHLNATQTDYDVWGLDLWKELDAWRFSAGSFFSLYKYDYFDAIERDNVRTYYLEARFKKRSSDHNWRFRYAFEDSDAGDFHRLRLEYTWFL